MDEISPLNVSEEQVSGADNDNAAEEKKQAKHTCCLCMYHWIVIVALVIIGLGWNWWTVNGRFVHDNVQFVYHHSESEASGCDSIERDDCHNCWYVGWAVPPNSTEMRILASWHDYYGTTCPGLKEETVNWLRQHNLTVALDFQVSATADFSEGTINKDLVQHRTAMSLIVLLVGLLFLLTCYRKELTRGKVTC
jgi:hypothetical protein